MKNNDVEILKKIIGYCDDIEPVSYTHLDVYKRQIFDNKI